MCLARHQDSADRHAGSAPGQLEQTTQCAAEAIARRFGAGRIDAAIQAHVIAVVK